MKNWVQLCCKVSLNLVAGDCLHFGSVRLIGNAAVAVAVVAAANSYYQLSQLQWQCFFFFSSTSSFTSAWLSYQRVLFLPATAVWRRQKPLKGIDRNDSQINDCETRLLNESTLRK